MGETQRTIHSFTHLMEERRDLYTPKKELFPEDSWMIDMFKICLKQKEEKKFFIC